MYVFHVSDPALGTLLHSGSGIITCPHVIALEKAGFSNVKLYSGSWRN